MNPTDRNILIVFTDAHLSYSPSTLNLYDSLEKYFNVTILTFSPNESYSSHRLLNKKVEYIAYRHLNEVKGVPLIIRLANEIKKSFFPKNKKPNPLLTAKAIVLIDKIKNFDGIIIAIDFFALWCVQRAEKLAHLFSLEILENDFYRNDCNFNAIQSVAIQTHERYTYLFGEKKIKTFLIQNAPKYINQTIDYNNRRNTNLVYCGSALPEFGIFSCIEFLMDYPEYALTIKGAVPPVVRKSIIENFEILIKQRRLILNEEYLSPEDLNVFLGDYFIGLVFYDAYRFNHINTFNFKTAPSGKLFQYFNAGIPVIGSEIEGLKAIEKFGAGIMIKSLNASAIKNAIATIEVNYLQFAQSAKNASIHFDFSRSVASYVTFLNSH